MKIVQTVSDIGIECAGPAYSVPGLCQGLTALGEQVEIHVTGDIPVGRTFDFPIYNYPRSRWPVASLVRSPQMLRGLEKSCKDAQIIHNNGLWQMPNVYCDWARGNAKSKLVLAPRGMLSQLALSRGKWKKWLFGVFAQYRVLKHVDMFHATSLKEYEEIRRLGYRQPIALVPIGMDVPRIDEAAARADRQKRGDSRKIVFLGRVHPTKAADHLLIAWKRICDRYPQWSVEIAGPDCGAVEGLRQLIAEQQIPRVKFSGIFHGQDKYDYLARADLYVLPSLTENFGITIAEALACGVPVIATKGSPWGGLVEQKCGWWTEIGPDALVPALEEALSLTDRQRRDMGALGRDWIAREYSWKGVAGMMRDAYRWLILGGEKPNVVKD